MRIMQCWDDGDVDDIRLVEILKKHGAKATFNICPGGAKSERRKAHDFGGKYDVYRLTLDEMPQVYEGFCIGGHTMTHPSWRLRSLSNASSSLRNTSGRPIAAWHTPAVDMMMPSRSWCARPAISTRALSGMWS